LNRCPYGGFTIEETMDITIDGRNFTVHIEMAEYTKPDHRADSDLDFFGGWELAYTIEENGKPVTLSPSLAATIENRIIEELEND
jgi:hypothetical protein